MIGANIRVSCTSDERTGIMTKSFFGTALASFGALLCTALLVGASAGQQISTIVTQAATIA